MSNWRGYFGIENINLNSSQRAILITELRDLGPSNHLQPAYFCHWRSRLDNDAAIFEAQFNEDNLTLEKFKQRLGSIFGVDPDTIDHASIQRDYAGYGTPVVMFSRGGIDYLRMALFGGTAATWEESKQEALGYLSTNRGKWGD